MGYAGAALGGAGSAISTMQALKENEYQSKMLGAQATQAGYMATSAEDAAAFEEAKYRYGATRVLAASRTQVAAGGLDITKGSPLLMDLESTRNAELTALNVRRTGAVQAQGYRYQQGLIRSQRSYVNSQRSVIIAHGVISGLQSIMGGAMGQPTTPTEGSSYPGANYPVGGYGSSPSYGAIGSSGWGM